VDTDLQIKICVVAGKIIRTARQTILKFLEGYPYQEVFHKSCYRIRPVDKGELLKQISCG
jgi:hypothetical protein